MGFLKRAFIAIKNRKSKTFLMLAILFVIGTMIMAGFAIHKATQNAMVQARKQLGSTITISYDMQKAMESTSQSKGTRSAFTSVPINVSDLSSILSMDHISGYNYFVTGSGNAVDFEPVEETMSEDDKSFNNQNMPKMNNDSNEQMQDVMRVSTGDITISGILDTSTETSSMTLTEGRNLTLADVGENNILIEKNLLEANDLKLGDTISITSASKTDVTLEFTIVGIYESTSVNNMRPAESYNTIYMPYDVVSANFRRASYDTDTETNTYSEGIDSAVFYVDDPEYLDSVIDEITDSSTIDTSKYKVSSDNSTYDQMIEPIKNVQKFASTSIIVIVIAGVFILTLILVLFIRERIYEVGVLLSLGESKFKINLQMISEVLIVGILAFTLSIFSGTILSNKISDSLIQSQISSLSSSKTANLSTMKDSPNTEQSQGGKSGGMGQMFENMFQSNENVDYVDSIEVNITIEEIALLFGCGTLIILLGVSVPMFIISRYSPRKILSNQD